MKKHDHAAKVRYMLWWTPTLLGLPGSRRHTDVVATELQMRLRKQELESNGALNVHYQSLTQ